MTRLESTEYLKAPFTWFGGKSKVAHIVWPRLGNIRRYIEPFAGSLAVTLLRPHWPWSKHSSRHEEVLNDLDGSIVNFWRAIQHDPDQVAHWADNPVFELDLHARHQWLHKKLTSTKHLDSSALDYAKTKRILPFAAWLATNPNTYDCKVAGWWCWGLSAWMGDNWARPKCLSKPDNKVKGVNQSNKDGILLWFRILSDRLQDTMICCGDWSRVCKIPPNKELTTVVGVFLDPPYSQDAGLDTVYREFHDPELSAKVRLWCIEHGDSPYIRIALCGYKGEGHEELKNYGWTRIKWKTTGGYGSLRKTRDNLNPHRERIWFSPHCLNPDKETKLISTW